ncbi:MAG: hypothetical protein ABI760_08455 [Ferruginibacter sp.]
MRNQTEEVTDQAEVVTKVVTDEVKKANNITTSVVSPFTSDDAYKQSKSKEKELFVVVSGEKKIFHFLLKLFETDEGLQENYEQKGLPPGNFPDALEQWMIQNNGAEYDDF